MIHDFHYGQFTWKRGRKRLLKAKEEKELTVSVGLPVFNEEKTLEFVINSVERLRNEGLVDQVMVFDSGSTDGSLKICKEKKIPCVLDTEAAKDLGVTLQRGKGFNLWASTHYLKGDILAWVDTDLRSLKSRIILGNVGPLIMHDELVFVKGRYRRPEIDNKVTRYVAEPLLSMLFPELNEVIDPLCGQYAGRRSELRKVPFDPSYGCEVSLLINMMQKYGPHRIAQAYIGPLKNRIRDTTYYGIMSGEIIITILQNAKKQGRIEYNGALKLNLVQQVTRDGVHYVARSYKIAHRDLPSMKYVESGLYERPATETIQSYAAPRRKVNPPKVRRAK
ncbi:MAG: glycosyltransferase [Nanoarchaeota archaeon]